jgi:LEA14-like dessication related protein
MRYFISTQILIICLMITGCSSFVQKPQVLLKRTNITGLDNAGADIEFYLGVTNPNPFDVSLLGYTYQLKVMSLQLAAGGLQENVLLASGQETEMRLPIRVSFAELLEVLKRKPDPERIPYKLNAQLQAKTFMGEVVIPFESNSTFSLPEQYRPTYYLDRFRHLLKPLSR